MIPLIRPDWAAPANVKAFSTTRLGGVSAPPWDSLNLGTHVGDSPPRVAENRRRLLEMAQLPGEPYWLNQTHSTRVVEAGQAGERPEADASWSNQAATVCLVMTADCLPILLCDKAGRQVAAVHAGWRGLCDGIIEQTLANFTAEREQILAWIGPAIGPNAFEVGGEVRQQFIQQDAKAQLAFLPYGEKYLANLPQLAEMRLRRAGLSAISAANLCTYSDPERFFSYRRDGQTGRLASFIWLASVKD